MQRIRPFLLLFFLSLVLLPTPLALAAPEKPTVRADTTVFDENTGRYHLIGHVSVISGNRITQMDDAQVSATELEIWGQNHVQMHVGDELSFTADAVYLEGFTLGNVLTDPWEKIWTNPQCAAIRAESANCNWNVHLVTFYGHVIYIEKGKEVVAETLTYDIEENRLR